MSSSSTKCRFICSSCNKVLSFERCADDNDTDPEVFELARSDDAWDDSDSASERFLSAGSHASKVSIIQI